MDGPVYDMNGRIRMYKYNGQTYHISNDLLVGLVKEHIMKINGASGEELIAGMDVYKSSIDILKEGEAL